MDFISRHNKLNLTPNPKFTHLYMRTWILFWNIAFIVKGALESRP